MEILRYLHPEQGPRLAAETADGFFDLTASAPETFGSIASWLRHPHPAEVALLAETEVKDYLQIEPDWKLLPPVDLQEIWAAGVTYERSKVARMEESEGGGDFYDRVYAAERPELFLKANGWRAVAPGDPVRIRKDSAWNVPEPELTLVLSAAGKVVGVTVGNDVSSRSIEGENPLYLPQAKVYDGSCAVGPTIRVLDTEIALDELTIRLTIERGGAAVYDAETSTSRMRRKPQELADWLFREYRLPDGALLMTGTGLVPPDAFTLQSGDLVRIAISHVGTLVNPVE